ncbi:MAG TPA: hypothetical protein VHG93_09135 [Longimicrobium sp.]|nr:hypothetical protein [Longimicrobium sp.]
MELTGISWLGPPADDLELLAELPSELLGVLSAVNGFVLYGGALHVRGAVHEPAWHSLRASWRGPLALANLYPAITPDDVPFGQDCVGDQFLLRQGTVARLAAETGEVEPLGMPLFEFLERACADPTGFLGAHPLIQHLNDAGELQPGMLLHAYPPFCTQQASEGVSLRAVPAEELIRFHAVLARQMAAIPEGGSFQVRVTDG